MDKSQLFFKTLIPSKSKIDVGAWEKVVDLFNTEKYKESFVKLFDYIDP